MKLTKRMKKILLILLHPKNIFPWVSEKFPWFIKRHQKVNGYPNWLIMSFCENKRNLTHSERTSYSRTFRILAKHGLIEWTWFDYGHYKLTSKGRKTAMEIEIEIKDFFKEYEKLIVF